MRPPKSSDEYRYNPMTGVKTDFAIIQKRFVETGSVRYENFAEIWRDMKMSLIFSGRQSDGEVREFTESCLELAKSHILPPNEFQVQVGGLYLMYALYFKQLFEPKVKVCVTIDDWAQIQNLLAEIRLQKHYDIEYIYWKLRHNNVFQFVAHAIPQSGLLPLPVEDTDGAAQQSRDATDELQQIQQDHSMVTEIMEGDAIDQLSAIHDQYHRVKCAMLGPHAKEPQASLNMIDSNVVQYITKKITTFEFWKKNRAGKRLSRRRHDSGPTTSESEADSETERGPSSPRKSGNMGRVRAEIKARAMSASFEVSRSRRHRQVRTESSFEDSPRVSTGKRSMTETSEDEANMSKTDSREMDSTFSPDQAKLISMPSFSHLEETNQTKRKVGRKSKIPSEIKSSKKADKQKPHTEGKKQTRKRSKKKQKVNETQSVSQDTVYDPEHSVKTETETAPL